jgi:hypothetical protein
MGKAEIVRRFGQANSVGTCGRLAIVWKARRAAALDVDSLHGVHETASGGDRAGRNHLQCAHLDESPRPSGGTIPDGGRGD